MKPSRRSLLAAAVAAPVAAAVTAKAQAPGPVGDYIFLAGDRDPSAEPRITAYVYRDHGLIELVEAR